VMCFNLKEGDEVYSRLDISRNGAYADFSAKTTIEADDMSEPTRQDTLSFWRPVSRRSLVQCA
jgi:hypothetical protein